MVQGTSKEKEVNPDPITIHDTALHEWSATIEEKFGKLYVTPDSCPRCGLPHVEMGPVQGLPVEILHAERVYEYLTLEEFEDCMDKCTETRMLVDLMREKLKEKIKAAFSKGE